MTELERSAMLGDAKSQRECTEKEIVLPCPFCGEIPRIICIGTFNDSRGIYSYWLVRCTECSTFKRGSNDYFTFCEETGEFIRDGNSKKDAIEKWNARHAPMILQCGECKHMDNSGNHHVC